MPDIFDAAAERIAYETQRSLSQVRAEIVAPNPIINHGLFEAREVSFLDAGNCEPADTTGGAE